jgi:hypothetical protein
LTVQARKPSCGGMLYRIEASTHTNVELPISAVTYAFSASVPRAASTKRVMKPFAWGATVRGTYPTPEAGTRTPYVQYVGPWGQAALCARHVPNAGGWYA